MANNLTVPSLGALPSIFQEQGVDDNLSSGITGSLAVMSFRGKVFRVKYNGVESPLMRPDGDGARGSIEVVILNSSSVLSKIYYVNGYEEGSMAPPDCWSSNGSTPDAQVENKQSPSCATCPKNAWSSAPGGGKGKACSDSKRLAVVFAENIENELLGGPMLLRVPAASLKNLLAYAGWLKQQGYPACAVVTKIAFTTAEYPQLVFTPVRLLTQPEAVKALEMRADDRTDRVIDSEHVEKAPAAEKPAFAFEQPPEQLDAPEKFVTKDMVTETKKTTKPKATVTQQVQAPVAHPQVQQKEPEVIDLTATDMGMDDMDAALEALLKPKS